VKTINQNTIFDVINSQGKTEAVLSAIHEWHEDCEHGQDGECEIYDAIRSGRSNKEIIEVAYDIDGDLFERFNL